MNEQIQTIGERMQARQAEAREKIKTMLWEPKPDLDAIAQVALAGGIEPAAVDRMAMDAEAAKGTLAAVVESHSKTAGLDKALTAAKAKATRAAKALESARQAAEVAERDQAGIESELHTARESVATAARAMQAGNIPADRAPAFLAELVEGWTAEETAQRRVSRMATLTAQVRWLEGRVEGLQAELKTEKADDPGRENKVASAGTLIPLQDAIQSRLKTEKAQLKTIKTELAELEKAG